MAAALPPAVTAWLGRQLAAEPVAIRPVAGGCIHRSWRVELAGGGQVFLKTNAAAALPLLEAELEGLNALATWASPDLQLPRPLDLACVGPDAVLLLSWLDLEPAAGGARDGRWRQLGQSLARLHRASREGNGGRGYGWDRDNFIGASLQPNGWCEAWPRFFVEARLGPQLDMAARAGRALRQADALLAQLPRWLARHAVEPVLVHGDLWSGNAALVRGGVAALFDPACYWGDREVDLAMARLFGGFPRAFFAGYGEEWPLSEGAPERVEIYNLYHLLNHANLFGGSYWSAAQACIDRFLAGASG